MIGLLRPLRRDNGRDAAEAAAVLRSLPGER